MFLKEFTFTMIPVFIFLFFCLVPILLIFYIFKHKIKNKKSPLNIELLRSPGETLRDQIDKSSDDILEYFIYLILLPVLVYSIRITQYTFGNNKLGMTYLILMGLILFWAVFYLLKKLYKLFKLRNSLRVGYECELAVGQGLQTLAKWLQNWVEKSTGDRYYVRPVLAIPGWYIHQKKSSDIRFTNGKNFDFLSKGNPVLTEKQIGVISFQIEKMCRTVEPKAYKKKETTNSNN